MQRAWGGKYSSSTTSEKRKAARYELGFFSARMQRAKIPDWYPGWTRQEFRESPSRGSTLNFLDTYSESESWYVCKITFNPLDFDSFDTSSF